MSKLTCGNPYNGLFVMQDTLGYIVKSCCEQQDLGHRVDSVKQIIDHPYIQSTRQAFENNTWPKGCEGCKQLEDRGLESQRQRSFKLFKMDTAQINPQHFSIRIDNHCNLKCVICNPVNSSKWLEDLDIYTEHNGELRAARSTIPLQELVPLIKTARSITVLGGEPLASKDTFELLDTVEDPSKCALFINTNAVSWSKRADQTISKPWRAVVMNLSIDAVGAEFELQRYPAQWNKVQEFVDLCAQRNWYIAVNTTVSAVNWHNIPSLTQWAAQFTPYHQLNILSYPKQLHINALTPTAVCSLDTSQLSPYMQQWQQAHSYDSTLNSQLKSYLAALDQRRGTDSKTLLPWCWL